MTIVAATDTRNAAWAADTSSFGQRMLSKMGWKGDGSGLGKNQQGTTHNLRAVRRADSLGIGAESDAFGEQGFAETSKGYRGVLSKLQEEYGGGGSGGSSGSGGEEGKAARKKRKKEEKKRKKREEKRRAKSAKNGGSSDEGGNGVRLAQNKVQAGHARKMREAKDLRNKSAADMAAVFGVKADVYAQSKDWITGEAREEKVEAPDAADGAAGADEAGAAAAQRERKKAKKRSKEKTDDANGEKAARKEKKRRRKEEGSSASERKKKRKKGKSKERS